MGGRGRSICVFGNSGSAIEGGGGGAGTFATGLFGRMNVGASGATSCEVSATIIGSSSAAGSAAGSAWTNEGITGA